MQRIKIPVLIVGGGGSGLSAAIFLADLGVEVLLVERHPATSHLPKAHYVNQRTMEIFRAHGLADAIYARGAPRENSGKIVFCTSLGGAGPLDAKTIVALDIMGGGDLKPVYDLKGTTPPVHIPQILLEPILREAAERRCPERLLFDHELTGISQDPQGVIAVVRNRTTGESFEVQAQYAIAADGGKTVGPALGVEMVGQTKMADYISVHFGADLSAYIPDDTSVMRVILSPRPPEEKPTLGSMTRAVLLAFGPDRWDRHNSDWTLAWADSYGAERMDEGEIADHVRRVLKVEVPITLRRVNHWALESVIADRFRVGRVLLAGDAAHKHTPAGGLGLNSGIQDAHNLAWKLALVLDGRADDGLLDSYEAERRPIVTNNAEMSVLGTSGQDIVMAALGVRPGAPCDYNETQIGRLLADTLDGERRRARMREVLAFTRTDYAGQDNELGFNYPMGAIVDDGSAPPIRDLMGADYLPTTRPGCRLPHVWVRQGDVRISTHDLLPPGGFLLMVGAQATGWRAAAQSLAADLGVTLRTVAIGAGAEADVTDPSGDWLRLRGVGEDGALLVRPDGHVAFRAQDGVEAGARLNDALRTILGLS